MIDFPLMSLMWVCVGNLIVSNLHFWSLLLAGSIKKLLFQLLLLRQSVLLILDFDSLGRVLEVYVDYFATFLIILLLGNTDRRSIILIIGKFISSLSSILNHLGIIPVSKFRNRIVYRKIIFAVSCLALSCFWFLFLNFKRLSVKSCFWWIFVHQKVCRLQSKLLFVYVCSYQLIILGLVRLFIPVNSIKGMMINVTNLISTGLLLSNT